MKMNRKSNYKNMDNLTNEEIGSKLWLSVKDISKITTLGQSTIYAFVSSGDFPKPYKKHGSGTSMVWDDKDVIKWMASLTDKWSAKSHGYVPVTWKAIKDSFGRAVLLSNSDIASMINGDAKDVSQITKLMEKAGELVSIMNRKTKLYSLIDMNNLK